ncbi:MAG: hypothetical protein R6X09_02435 [Bacteroidales bacterium]
MYLSSILMLLSWPLTIILCWFAVRIALNIYEKKQQETNANK